MAYLGTPATSKASGANRGSAAAGERRFNTEDISAQLLRILQPLHVDSLSLHDPAGELLWLNEGAFGPDEHGVVLDALDVFALDSSREDLQLKLDDDRTALLATARDAQGEIRGIALAIVETPASEEFAAKLAAPRLTALMRRFAQLLAPQVPTMAPAPAMPAPVPAVKPVEFGFTNSEVAPVRPERRAPTQEKPVSRSAVSGTIHARRYVRLRTGGAARHYEVKLAPNASFAADLMLATRVVEHLQRAGDRYTQAPTSFAVPISAQSVTQSGWIARLSPVLARAGLAEGLIGFCLPASAWETEFQAAERFIGECEDANCFVALDDFTLGSSGLSLLRSSAVKCLKLQPKLIGSVVQDKFAHATLAAIMQAARVLGLYCVAKQISSTSEAKWLAAAGIEFADGLSRGVEVASTRSDEEQQLQVGD